MLLARLAFSACTIASNISSLVQPSLLHDFVLPPNVVDCVGSGVKLSRSFLDPWMGNNTMPIQIDDIYPLVKHFGPFGDSDVDPTGLSVAIWFSPSEEDSSRTIQPIVSFNEPFRLKSYDGCEGYQIQLALINRNKLLVAYSDNDEFRNCRFLSDVTISGTSHVVISLSASQTIVYVNGEAALEVPNEFDITLENWYSVDSLGLFTTPHIPYAGVFRGTIHQLDLFDTPLSDTVVSELFEQNITIVSNDLQVVVMPAQTTMVQGTLTPTPITIECDSALDLELRIIDLPRFGDLVTELHMDNLTQDIGIPLDSRISFNYTLRNRTYFNDPKTNMYGDDLGTIDEHFTYQVFGLWDGKVINKSNIIKHDIVVLHANHEPTLQAPENATLDPRGFQKAIVHNIDYSDVLDKDISKVLVHLSATHSLTLVPMYKSLADFTCSACFDHSNAKAFLAIPGSVNAILRGLYYERPENVEDFIEIRVHDVPSSNGTDDDCFVLQKTVRVEEWQSEDDGLLDARARIILYTDIYKAILLLVGCCCFFCCCETICRKRARGSEVEAD